MSLFTKLRAGLIAGLLVGINAVPGLPTGSVVTEADLGIITEAGDQIVVE